MRLDTFCDVEWSNNPWVSMRNTATYKAHVTIAYRLLHIDMKPHKRAAEKLSIEKL